MQFLFCGLNFGLDCLQNNQVFIHNTELMTNIIGAKVKRTGMLLNHSKNNDCVAYFLVGISLIYSYDSSKEIALQCVAVGYIVTNQQIRL